MGKRPLELLANRRCNQQRRSKVRTGDEFDANVMASLERLGEASQLLARSGVLLLDEPRAAFNEAAVSVYAAFPQSELVKKQAEAQLDAERTAACAEIEALLISKFPEKASELMDYVRTRLATANDAQAILVIKQELQQQIEYGAEWNKLDKNVNNLQNQEEAKEIRVYDYWLERKKQQDAIDAVRNAGVEKGYGDKKTNDQLNEERQSLDQRAADIAAMPEGAEKEKAAWELRADILRYYGNNLEELNKQKANALADGNIAFASEIDAAIKQQEQLKEELVEKPQKEYKNEDKGKTALNSLDEFEEPEIAEDASKNKEAFAVLSERGEENLGNMSSPQTPRGTMPSSGRVIV